MTKVIQHPTLGKISDVYESLEWQTEPLQIGVFGYESPINFLTENGAPSPKAIDDAVRLITANQKFKAEVECHMLEKYIEYIRPNYVATIGNPRYKQKLTPDDLPEIQEPCEIWRVIGGISSVFILEGDNEVSIGFIPKFDREHEFAVRYRNWEMYEVMIDG